ncbi:MAG: hypothetical protein KGD63_09070 [Candidatus Lokiarchaeota archaeon]|nr:hypothetical protein [Candidatus Lokiarchaeota archaeon]
MKYKKIALSIILLSFLLPICNIKGQEFPGGFRDIHNLDEGETLFYLVDLNNETNIQIRLSRLNYGNFSIFLFGNRPFKTYIDSNGQLDPNIYTDDGYINHSYGIKPYINQTVVETKIYYIQITLLNNGSDTFILDADRALARYYIPLIPGFPIYTTIGFSFIAIIFITLYNKKKILKKY